MGCRPYETDKKDPYLQKRGFSRHGKEGDKDAREKGRKGTAKLREGSRAKKSKKGPCPSRWKKVDFSVLAATMHGVTPFFWRCSSLSKTPFIGSV